MKGVSDEEAAAFAADPDWAGIVPEFRESAAKRHLPAHEDCSPLDVESAARHLLPGGTLGLAMPGYESRPGQVDMLRAVARAYNDRANLMVEAGTGVGKSLAYLIPSVLWAYTNDTPVVVSTATRNLQSQLVASDIPRAVKALGSADPKRPFRAALLKGRSNYLCLRALDELMRDGFFAFLPEDKSAFAALVGWLRATPDGDLDSFASVTAVDASFLARLSCPGEDCSGRRCRFYRRCFVMKARARAAAAHLVVVNHALVLAEATLGTGGILPAYGRLVFDEAHDLEDIATDYLSSELSRPVLGRLLRRLVRPSGARAAKGGGRGGVLESVSRQLEKGSLGSAATAEAIRELVTKARVHVAFVQRAGDDLFTVLERLLSVAPGADLVRFRAVAMPPPEPGRPPRLSRRSYNLNGLFAEYPASKWSEADLAAASAAFEDALAKLLAMLIALNEDLAAADGDGELPLFADLASQVAGAAAALKAFIVASKFVLASSDPSCVYWIERVALRGRPSAVGHRPAEFVRVVAAPLSVADQMRKLFYESKDSAILCSATLRVGSSFDYMARRLGFCPGPEPAADAHPPRVYRSVVAASPFDYLKQSLVLAPDCLPDPASDSGRYAEALAAFLKDLFAATRGRALVLFTSYEMMRAVAARAEAPLAAAGIRLLVQGAGLARERLAALLREADGGAPVVLFGAQSFWEGVDVPGAALSCVVLARLPFPQVGEPIIAARCEKIEAVGGSSFRDYMLPEAVVRFRQGFGRLIRTKSDRGVVVITDPRLVTKNYGSLFRKSIPASVHTVAALADLLGRVRGFFGG